MPQSLLWGFFNGVFEDIVLLYFGKKNILKKIKLYLKKDKMVF
jgi:hypothetical protein